MAREGVTNAGKKEQRQFNQILDKAVKEGHFQKGGQQKETEARTTPRGHSQKGMGGK
jgi:hypothetical protein